MKILFTFLLLGFFVNLNNCNAQQDLAPLRVQLQSLVSSHKSDIAFALIHIENKDTLTINNNLKLPMQSVYKFPLAIYILHLVDEGKLSILDKVHVTKEDVSANTWSPMKKKYPEGKCGCNSGRPAVLFGFGQ